MVFCLPKAFRIYTLIFIDEGMRKSNKYEKNVWEKYTVGLPMIAMRASRIYVANDEALIYYRASVGAGCKYNS